MEPKRSKYDTNPLDRDIVDRAEQTLVSPPSGASTQNVEDRPTSNVGDRYESEAVNGYAESEAPTRFIDEKLASPYQSIFAPPPPRPTAAYQPPRVAVADIYQPPPVPPPGLYQPQPVLTHQRPAHSVAGLGIPEKWANLLPYIPGHIGAVAAVVELLLVPRTETRTRFHAAQGLALQIAILILTGAFGMLTLITDSGLGSGILRTASTVFLIVSMIRAFKGRPHHIAPLDDATRWLDEKIKPRK
ncbi:MAG TPA: hypothetical protein VJS64_08110 [Pyrinomonadaceae bacterium]|nr:hypothetical protein [Pyrinomonadaceae bacterium]